jgi:antitoxin (DNA-binding transcriptional repressor) of toxin-antitoxin stability system
VVIANNGQPVARLVPVKKRPIVFELLKGKIEVPDDFGDPLPDDILDAFEGVEP